jgi:hypothetical protein
MDPNGIRFITGGQLHNSRVPTAELAATAYQAMQGAGIPLGAADFIVVAVPAGTGADEVADLERRLEARP